jgi:cell division septation protein DedD
LKEETRYRVTGSLFLLALAVIFLPMLFDGAGLPRVELEPVAPPPIAAVELPEPPALDPELPVRVEALAEQVDPEGFLTETDTRLGEPVLSDAGPTT